ncbi:hypothetical protein AKJ09_01997 [Labilithrix luteola]|uniref:IgGFc-binding protein N-terminal domain-containing protein n=1 Tax=Labilithrix luteola TaxID=1391654 RepID=A0A0K1PP84_9BACT|nr:IgGFc-binding protein [Labilithrix luteola]AKU95333.1 hypothetical protein AKJ09_01997 [Labilithrix luteola]
MTRITQISAAAFVSSALVVSALGACARSPSDGLPPDQGFDFTSDAAPEDAGCPLRCSLDLGSVVRSCDGTLVEQCPPELACGTTGCVAPCEAMANAQSSLGCEFYAQPPQTTIGAGSCYAAYVINAWHEPITLDLALGDRTLDLSNSVFRFKTGSAELEAVSGPIQPNDAVVVFLSDAHRVLNAEGYTACPDGAKPAIEEWTAPMATGMGKSFRITTSGPAAVSTIYPFGGAKSYFPTATLLLPSASWGTQHILVEPWQRSLRIDGSLAVPGVQIVAREDATEVTIRPVKDIQPSTGIAGAPAGQSTVYKLGKGEFLQLAQSDEISGSLVTSNKPIATFGEHACMDIPVGVAACDVEQKQIPAFDQWGQEYAAVRYRGRTSKTESIPYRIVAGIDGTKLSYDPAPPAGAPTTMAAGEVTTFWTDSPFVVRSQDVDHPIYLAAYMTGGGNPGLNRSGDPEAVNVVPTGQYMNAYSFYADPTYEETSLVVIRAKSEAGVFEDVTLECAGGPLTDWQPLGTAGKFEYRLVDLIRAGGAGETFPGGTCTKGLHRMNSKGPFTATIWGWGVTASYAYPGGMAQRTLVKTRLVVN